MHTSDIVLYCADQFIILLYSILGQTSIELDYKDPVKRKEFVKHLLDDLTSLEKMIEADMFEKGAKRIGVEQEFCIIDYSLRPLMKNLELIDRLKDYHFTTELAKFNLEINLDPMPLKSKCFSKYENDLIRLLTKANRHVHKIGGKVILAGILPSIKKSDIEIEHITPIQRYMALNEVMTKSRGKEFEVNIHGIDELITKTNSVLFESCNTSFQSHFQIDVDDFKEMYNWAMAISAPVLACSVNSPVFLGKRLWKETRIALFQQSTDIRKGESGIREERPRVFFGSDWEYGNIVEHYRENLSRFKILLTRDLKESSLKAFDRGETPSLSALSLFNGTIYKWNRVCYGLTEGKPHVRIEARYIPSGPTIVDEIANIAFWVGLMNGIPDHYRNIDKTHHFDDIKGNFYKAAQFGLSAQFTWNSKKLITAQELILNELLPIAEDGLRKAKVEAADINKYLGIIRNRVKSERTGAQWVLDSINNLKKDCSNEECITAVTQGMYKRQKMNRPVHSWKLAEFDEGSGWQSRYWKIGQVMSSDLITVGPNELIDLVRNIMLWSNIRHVPVENDEGELIGMISSDGLLNFYGNNNEVKWEEVEASEIMEKDLITVSPETLTIDAIRIMKQNESSCLPVISNGKLVGLFTERDYIKIGEHILNELTKEKNKSAKS